MHQELLGVNIWESDHCGDRQKLRVSGHTIADADLVCVSTLPHAHSIPNGTYGFRMKNRPSPPTRQELKLVGRRAAQHNAKDLGWVEAGLDVQAREPASAKGIE
ncbi:MAG: hypothetical protein JO097_21260 [Acidobacteriaceae bacterium]|nr:hypothetical protein [Acidobacteriaceae bacterium]